MEFINFLKSVPIQSKMFCKIVLIFLPNPSCPLKGVYLDGSSHQLNFTCLIIKFHNRHYPNEFGEGKLWRVKPQTLTLMSHTLKIKLGATARILPSNH